MISSPPTSVQPLGSSLILESLDPTSSGLLPLNTNTATSNSLLGSLFRKNDNNESNRRVLLSGCSTPLLRSIAMEFATAIASDQLVHWLVVDGDERSLQFPPYTTTALRSTLTTTSNNNLSLIQVHHFPTIEKLCEWLLLVQPPDSSSSSSTTTWILDAITPLSTADHHQNQSYQHVYALLVDAAANCHCHRVVTLVHNTEQQGSTGARVAQQQQQQQHAFWNPTHFHISRNVQGDIVESSYQVHDGGGGVVGKVHLLDDETMQWSIVLH